VISKICNITLIYGRIAEISAYYRKLGLRDAMVTSDLRPEVEIWPFRACAMKKMQYKRYDRNSLVIVDLALGQIPRSTEHITSYMMCSHLLDTC